MSVRICGWSGNRRHNELAGATWDNGGRCVEALRLQLELASPAFEIDGIIAIPPTETEVAGKYRQTVKDSDSE